MSGFNYSNCTAGARRQKCYCTDKGSLFNLLEIPKTGIIFGHQDDLAYGVNWKAESGRSDVKEVCGDYPGVYGWDISRL
jgi:hypothetical protein